MFVVAASCLGSSSGTRQSRFMRRCSIGRSSRAPQVNPTCFVFCRRCVWEEKKSIYLLIRYARVFDWIATLRLGEIFHAKTQSETEGHGVRRDFLSTADWTRDEMGQWICQD